MPTIVDSLIVTLGLDPKDFEQGQKKAADAWLKTRQEAVKGSKEIEDAGKGAAEGIDKVTKSVLGLFAVLLGARSLADFAINITSADAALGRLAQNTGMSAQNFSAWQMAAERMGGSAQGMAASIQTASQQIVNLRTNGQRIPDGANRLLALAGMHFNTAWSTQDYLLALANAAKADVGTMGAPVVSTLLSQSGFTPDFGNLAIARGGAGLAPYLNSLNSLAPTDRTIGAMQDLIDKWETLTQEVQAFAQRALGDLDPTITKILDRLDAWLNNPDTLKAFDQGVEGFTDALNSVDWPTVGKALLDIANALLSIVQSIGGWIGGGSGQSGLVFGGSLDRAIGSARQKEGLDPTSGWWTPDRQAHAYQRLTKEAGLSDAGARALISRWANVESPGGPASANDIGGGHWGIAQWDFSRSGLGVWGNPNYDAQLSNVIKELNGPESAAARALRGAGTDAQGAIGASMYERAAGFNAATGTDNFTGKTLAGMRAIAIGAASTANILKWAQLSGLQGRVSGGGTSVTIGQINLPMSKATDARGISQDIAPALRRALAAQPANGGPA